MLTGNLPVVLTYQQPFIISQLSSWHLYWLTGIVSYQADNSSQFLAATYRKHEKWKCHAYEQRVCEIEYGFFTPLIMSATGAAAKVCHKRLASLLSVKWNMPFSCTLAWIRCKLSFSVIRSSIQCIRGSRSSPLMHPCHLAAFYESGITVAGHWTYSIRTLSYFHSCSVCMFIVCRLNSNLQPQLSILSRTEEQSLPLVSHRCQGKVPKGRKDSTIQMS